MATRQTLLCETLAREIGACNLAPVLKPITVSPGLRIISKGSAREIYRSWGCVLYSSPLQTRYPKRWTDRGVSLGRGLPEADRIKWAVHAAPQPCSRVRLVSAQTKGKPILYLGSAVDRYTYTHHQRG